MRKHHYVNFKATSAARNVTENGKEYLVVPVVALVAGVLNESLALADAFAPTADRWNGIPITVKHPENNDGSWKSAKDAPGQTIGHIRNSAWADNSLKLEAWIDVADAKAKGFEGVVNSLVSGAIMEVSTGFLAYNVPATGTHNGKAYNNIWQEPDPDHLALLPDQIGACSASDGCGTNRNFARKAFDAIKRFVTNGTKAASSNELTYWDTEIAVRRALDSESPAKEHSIFAMFDGRVIYRVYPRDPNVPYTASPLYQRSYSVGADDQITLDSDVIEVIEKTDFVPVNNSLEETTMTKAERVKALITNSKGRFQEADAKGLEALSDAALDSLEAKEPGKNCADAPVALTAESIAQIVSDTVDKKLEANKANEEKAERDTLIKAIVANSKEYSEDELNESPTALLRKLAGKKPIANYGGRGVPSVLPTGEDAEWDAPELIVNARDRKEGK